MIDIRATIKYDPAPLSGSIEKMFRPWWMIVTIGGDMTDYYAWFLKQRTGWWCSGQFSIYFSM